MNLSNSILKDIREAVGLGSEVDSFDTELLMHINASISKLNQNGVGNTISVTDDSTTWSDLRNDSQVNGNEIFHTVPLFIALSTKIIFDPPPPSTVEQYARNSEEMLWRLKIAYELGSV